MLTDIELLPTDSASLPVQLFNNEFLCAHHYELTTGACCMGLVFMTVQVLKQKCKILSLFLPNFHRFQRYEEKTMYVVIG